MLLRRTLHMQSETPLFQRSLHRGDRLLCALLQRILHLASASAACHLITCLTRRLLIFDTHGLVHRAYWHLSKEERARPDQALPPPALNSMVLDVAASLGQHVKATNPTHFMACFDPDSKNWRQVPALGSKEHWQPCMHLRDVHAQPASHAS